MPRVSGREIYTERQAISAAYRAMYHIVRAMNMSYGLSIKRGPTENMIVEEMVNDFREALHLELEK